MSSKQKKLPFWCCCKNDSTKRGSHNSFVQIASDLMFCKPFNELGLTARLVYVYMAAAAGGKMEFVFPHSLYQGLMSNDTFKKARKELIDSGFIALIASNKNLRRPSQYAFSTEWKNRLTEEDCKRCGRCRRE